MKSRKGLTMEEIFGVERAKEIKIKRKKTIDKLRKEGKLTSPNKGKKLPYVTKRNLENNPMKNPETRKKSGETQRRLYREGKIKHWSIGLTKETDERIKKASIKHSKTVKKLWDEGKYKKERIVLDGIKENIIKLYLEGNSTGYISKKYNLDPYFIRKRLKKWGIKIRTTSESLKLEHKKGRIKTWQKGTKGLVKSNSGSFKKGQISWIKGFTKDTNEIVKAIAEGKIGEKNPNWLGGISFEPYSSNFNNKFKRAIRKRDNYICLKCGKHQEREKRALSIHHINYDKKLTIKQNCCSVCKRCNSEVNSNREHWTKFFQSLLSEKYDYKYSEKGEVILEAQR